MKYSTIQLHIVDDQGDILDVRDMFDTLKEAKERVRYMLKNPKMAFDDAAEIEGWHKRVYSIRLVTSHEGKREECLEEWFPKFYEANPETCPYCNA